MYSPTKQHRTSLDNQRERVSSRYRHFWSKSGHEIVNLLSLGIVLLCVGHIGWSGTLL